MITKKIIHWCKEGKKNNKGEMVAVVHLLVGYNRGTVQDYEMMADEIRQTFPQAKNEEIFCRKIKHSDSMDGYTLAFWETYLSEGEYPGWTQFKPAQINYDW